MIPLVALAVTFGFIVCWMIWQSSNQTSDRMLIGSVRLLAQAVDANDEIRDRMIPQAVRLLQRRAAPATYFSVWDGPTLIADDPRLKPPTQYDRESRALSQYYSAATVPNSYRKSALSNPEQTPEDRLRILQPTYLRHDFLGKKEIRIATEVRRLHRSDHPVVIQVADLMETRRYYEYGYFLRVFAVAVLIVIAASISFYWAIAWGLGPFASLTDQIETARPEQQSQFRLSLEANAPHEARLLASAFNALLARTDRAIDLLRQFTANASHQLRTPLAVMRVHLDILQREGAKSPKAAAAANDLSHAVTSLEHLLVQLLTLARAEELGIDGASQFNLTDIAADIIAGCITQPEAASLDISFEAPQDEPILVLGHPDLAAEMIANLFDNAVRYNREGGKVTIRILALTDKACIEIENNGLGIPAKDQDRVFEPFYRAQNSRNTSGSGLGLPIVKTLADRMGADVVLESGPDNCGVLARILFQTPAPAGDAEPSLLRDRSTRPA